MYRWDGMCIMYCRGGDSWATVHQVSYNKKNYVGSMAQSPCPIRLEGFNVTEKFRLKKIHTFCGNQKWHDKNGQKQNCQAAIKGTTWSFTLNFPNKKKVYIDHISFWEFECGDNN